MKSFINKYLLYLGILASVAVLLFPYLTNGFYFDDALNSQLFFYLERTNQSLLTFSLKAIKYWINDGGRIVLSLIYGYPFFYIFNSLELLRFVQILGVIGNIFFWFLILHECKRSKYECFLWAIFFCSLFYINGQLDPVAGFAMHYQLLCLQLQICIYSLIRWIKNPKVISAIVICVIWFLFMLSYEINVIFIVILLLICGRQIYVNKNINSINERNRAKKNVFMIIIALVVSLLWLLLTSYVKQHAAVIYEGIQIDLTINSIVAYFKQLSGVIPFLFVWSNMSHSKNIGEFINHYIFKVDSLLLFLLFFATIWGIFKKIDYRPRSPNLDIVFFVMLFMPPVLVAVSGRYQQQVYWGVATLPVYYGWIAMSYFLIKALYIIKNKIVHFLIIGCYSFFMQVNFQHNLEMIKKMDIVFRAPRDLFKKSVDYGNLSKIKDGDVLYKSPNIPSYVNANLIYQYTGKNVFIPTEKDIFSDEKPSLSPSYYYLLLDANHYYLSEEAIIDFNSGWSGQESGHRWSIDKSSFIQITNITNKLNLFEIGFELNGLVSQNVEILINGVLIKKIHLTSIKGENVYIKIALNSGVNTLNIKSDTEPRSPGNGDSRYLSFNIVNFGCKLVFE